MSNLVTFYAELWQQLLIVVLRGFLFACLFFGGFLGGFLFGFVRILSLQYLRNTNAFCSIICSLSVNREIWFFLPTQ